MRNSLETNKPRHLWKTLLHRVLNESFPPEIELLPRWLVEYSLEEIERVQRVSTTRRWIVPTSKTHRLIFTFERAVLRFADFDPQRTNVEILPSIASWYWLMKISGLEQRDSLKKRVTSSFERREFPSPLIFFSRLAEPLENEIVQSASVR